MRFNLDTGKSYQLEMVQAILRVMNRNAYILGPELAAFEQEWAKYTGAKHAVGCGSGTDGIRIALQGLGVGQGDEVISPAFNVAYTALGIANTGATPIFADVLPKDLLMDLDQAEQKIGPHTRAMIYVLLYGNTAGLQRAHMMCQKHGIFLVVDACQAHGAMYDQEKLGTFGDAVVYSFYPTKNLGALGDGGAITTNNATWAKDFSQIRDGGRSDRYQHEHLGINSGLDEMQAAVLRVRLRHLAEANIRRREIGTVYRRGLSGENLLMLPNYGSVYHLFPIIVRREFRTALQNHLEQRGIPTFIHYPIPVPLQPCFSYLRHQPGEFPIAEKFAEEVLSLPMHPEMTDAEVLQVVEAIHDFPMLNYSQLGGTQHGA